MFDKTLFHIKVRNRQVYYSFHPIVFFFCVYALHEEAGAGKHAMGASHVVPVWRASGCLWGGN